MGLGGIGRGGLNNLRLLDLVLMGAGWRGLVCRGVAGSKRPFSQPVEVEKELRYLLVWLVLF